MLTRKEKRLIVKTINGKMKVDQLLVKKAIDEESKKIKKLENAIAEAIAKQEALGYYELLSQDMNPVIGIKRRCRAGIKSSKRRLERLEKLVA